MKVAADDQDLQRREFFEGDETENGKMSPSFHGESYFCFMFLPVCQVTVSVVRSWLDVVRVSQELVGNSVSSVSQG